MRQLKISKSITNREDSTLDKYLQEITQERLLTAEEEIALLVRLKKATKMPSKSLQEQTYALLFQLQNNTNIKDLVFQILSMKVILA